MRQTVVTASWMLALALVLPAAAQQPDLPAAAENDDWPQWRGPNRDGNTSADGLLPEWPSDGPPVAWHVNTVGAGYASVAVVNGRIYTQGDVEGIEQVLCLNAEDGSILWQVQPEPVAQALAQRVSEEFQKIDTSGDGRIDEVEALTRFGWEWNKYNQVSDKSSAARRTSTLFAAFDRDTSGELSFEEAGEKLRAGFDAADTENKSVDAAQLAAKRTAAYLKLDKNADEQISKDESKGTSLERHFGRIDLPVPPDEKGDEQLTPDEIKQALLKHEPGRDGLLTPHELFTHFAATNATGDAELTEAELRSALGGYRSGMGDGPRGTPAVDGDRVYIEGALGDVSCLDAKTGSTLWHVNLVKDFGGQMPGAGYCESPLVSGNLLIVSPGGKGGTILALDKLTGEKVWQSSEITEQPDYASPIGATIGGIPQIVQFSHESVFGVAADGGKLLWRFTEPSSKHANCCTPIVVGDLVFASSGYDNGGGLAKIVNGEDGRQVAEEVFFQKKMACHYGGMVKVGDCVYSNANGPLLCMDFETGDINWQDRSVGKGSVIAAGGLLYVVSEGHEIALVEANPDEYVELGRFKSATTKKPVLSHPAIAGGKLFVREQEQLTAYDLRAAEQPMRLAKQPAEGDKR